MFYVDTSVLVPYYCPETASGAAERFLTSEKNLAVSDLGELEFGSALARKVREGGLAPEDAGRAVALFRTHLEGEYFRRLTIEPAHFRLASEWVSRNLVPLRSLDALHLAVASSEGRCLATFDRRLAAAAAALALPVNIPNDE